MIQQAANRAADLVEKLLAYSRRKKLNFQPVDLHEIMGETLALLRNLSDSTIGIEVQLEAAQSTIWGDPSQLQAVLINLGINALHAMEKTGGLLIYKTKVILLEEQQGLKELFIPGLYLQCKVIDQGEGISPENLPRIFEPFFTTKAEGKGTGLGLAAAKSIVLQQNGRISVESKEGHGTEFTLLFPLIENLNHGKAKQEVILRGSGKILLADDEPIIRSIGKTMLESLGYQVLLAEDGAQALEIFQEAHGSIDLVILDMLMPKLNGRDSFFAIREIQRDIPILLCSGFAPPEDVKLLEQSGLKGFLPKPFNRYLLGKMVAQCLGKENS
ncbi:MAG: response regulator [Spirochaetaceae bacterium]|jgi:CheY-like chemotaxis protein|nr:response regulator [Spirochaetaceae bacterium]